MNRRTFLGTIGAAPFGLQAANEKPNFIVIYTDDIGYGDLGCYGAADAKTPNIDKLAASGVRFTNWHTNSPVCSPSRASLMTGKYPQNAGIPEILTSKPDFQVAGLKKGETTLPGELKKLGYKTAAVGKWHLGSTTESRPRPQGFDEYFGFLSGWIDYYSHRYYTLGGQPIFHDLWRNETEVFEEPMYQTELLSREAQAFVNRQAAAQPFFLYLAFGAPHYPMMAPKKYLDRFPESMDRDRRLHCAVIAAVDDAVGQLVATLSKKKMLNNTVIFFQSDNGATHEVRADHMGRPYEGGSNKPNRGWKGGLFEGGVRLPGIFSWPGHIKAGQVPADVGITMDVLPTFLKLAGGQTPKGTDGIDISSTLLEGKPIPTRDLFWDYQGHSAIRRGDWKLLKGYRDELNAKVTDGYWLSNLKEDEKETTNLAAKNPEMVKTLAAALEDWRKTWLKPVA